MNIENRAVKLYIKELPPSVAIDLFEQYKIPSPYKEILTIVCVERKGGYKAMRHWLLYSAICCAVQISQALVQFAQVQR